MLDELGEVFGLLLDSKTLLVCVRSCVDVSVGCRDGVRVGGWLGVGVGVGVGSLINDGLWVRIIIVGVVVG